MAKAHKKPDDYQFQKAINVLRIAVFGPFLTNKCKKIKTL